MARRRFGWRWNENAFDGADGSPHITIAEQLAREWQELMGLLLRGS